MISKNAIGIALLALGILGFQTTESEVVKLISSVMEVFSFCLMIFNQMERRDVFGFFFKKK